MSNTITVSVHPEYIANQSDPSRKRYAFAYHITVHNHGQSPAQLISRYWRITDANEGIKEVRGVGVIGEQPTIPPGGRYQYSSGVVLETPIGTMEGSYQMSNVDGSEFEAAIATFLLSSPGSLH